MGGDETDGAIHISTDGSNFPGDPPITAWAWVEHSTGRHDEGGTTGGVIQLGELCAILQALREFPDAESIVIESDSASAIRYAQEINCVWTGHGWAQPNGNPLPYYMRTIRAIHEAMGSRHITFRKVKAHTNDRFNSRADQLAKDYAREYMKGRALTKIPREAFDDLMEATLPASGHALAARGGAGAGKAAKKAAKQPKAAASSVSPPPSVSAAEARGAAAPPAGAGAATQGAGAGAATGAATQGAEAGAAAPSAEAGASAARLALPAPQGAAVSARFLRELSARMREVAVRQRCLFTSPGLSADEAARIARLEAEAAQDSLDMVLSLCQDAAAA